MADRSSNRLFKYPGGFLKSDVFYYGEDDKDEHIFAVVWGEVIRNPKIQIFKNGKKRTDFAIRYLKGGYIIVMIYGDTPAADAAASLHATDMVCVKGIITRHRYENKQGEKRETRFLVPFSVEPYDYTLFVQRLYNSPTINRLLEQDESDAMESAKDFGIMEEEDSFDEIFH